jgi:hypothetical protein
MMVKLKTIIQAGSKKMNKFKKEDDKFDVEVKNY